MTSCCSKMLLKPPPLQWFNEVNVIASRLTCLMVVLAICFYPIEAFGSDDIPHLEVFLKQVETLNTIIARHAFISTNAQSFTHRGMRYDSPALFLEKAYFLVEQSMSLAAFYGCLILTARFQRPAQYCLIISSVVVHALGLIIVVLLPFIHMVSCRY
ncbi:hypothetical protein BC943DRAFT_330553 [Umbelopsis sp. AD052]|nr:hypothetical protein BC943DRAFT_330553 [Umbelopsis sp. AD052]